MKSGPSPRAAKAQPVVFVVDDDPSVREALGSLFRSVDLDVELFVTMLSGPMIYTKLVRRQRVTEELVAAVVDNMLAPYGLNATGTG